MLSFLITIFFLLLVHSHPITKHMTDKPVTDNKAKAKGYSFPKISNSIYKILPLGEKKLILYVKALHAQSQVNMKAESYLSFLLLQENLCPSICLSC